MSVWIDAAASRAVAPRGSVQARVSFSPAVKKAIRSSASKRRADDRGRARSGPSSGTPPPRPASSSASSASSLRSIAESDRPVQSSTTSSRLVVSGSSSGGRSPGQSARICRPPGGRAPPRAAPTSSRSSGSPDFACDRTRSSRRSTWSRSATSSSSWSLQVASGSRPGEAVDDREQRVHLAQVAEQRRPGAGDVDDAQRGGGDLLRGHDRGERGSRSSAIGAMPTFSFSLVRRRRAGARERVEERRLAGRSAGRRCRPRAPLTSARAMLLLQRDERPVLERLHGALGLAEDRRRLAVREVEDELQGQHLPLLGRERPRSCPSCSAARSLQGLRLGGGPRSCRAAPAPPPPAASGARRGSGPSRGCARSGRARPRTAPSAQRKRPIDSSIAGTSASSGPRRRAGCPRSCAGSCRCGRSARGTAPRARRGRRAWARSTRSRTCCVARPRSRRCRRNARPAHDAP